MNTQKLLMIILYMQVQCQLFCTQRSYCDFVVWTEKDVHIERIYPDESFWLESVSRVRHFFVTSILPELIGKFYSRTSELVSVTQTPSPSGPSCSVPLSEPGPSSSVPSVKTDGDSAKTYCYCQGPEYGDMVGCDNPSCLHEWFHLSCLKLVCQPKSKYWYCPDCRKLPEIKRKKSKKLSS